jgi:hypothetical protein
LSGRSNKGTVWYEAIADEIYFTYIFENRFVMQRGWYVFNGIEMTNNLGLIYWKVFKRNWNKAVKDGYLIKLGRL